MNWIIVSKLLCIIMCYVLIVILDNTVGIQVYRLHVC